jgi:rfaE bifunctional protein nucleotidyltransferase chain/domain
MGNVVAIPQLLIELSSRRKMSPRKPPRVVFTNGCFDILHVGHARYLRDAKALGEILVVGVNSDASVRTLGKGDDRPIQNESDRAELLAHLASVDFVVIFNEPTPEALIEQVVPDILVKGGDWKPEQILGSKFVLAKGGQVKSLPFHPGHSTSNLLARVDGKRS